MTLRKTNLTPNLPKLHPFQYSTLRKPSLVGRLFSCHMQKNPRPDYRSPRDLSYPDLIVPLTGPLDVPQPRFFPCPVLHKKILTLSQPRRRYVANGRVSRWQKRNGGPVAPGGSRAARCIPPITIEAVRERATSCIGGEGVTLSVFLSRRGERGAGTREDRGERHRNSRGRKHLVRCRKNRTERGRSRRGGWGVYGTPTGTDFSATERTGREGTEKNNVSGGREKMKILARKRGPDEKFPSAFWESSRGTP